MSLATLSPGMKLFVFFGTLLALSTAKAQIISGYAILDENGQACEVTVDSKECFPFSMPPIKVRENDRDQIDLSAVSLNDDSLRSLREFSELDIRNIVLKFNDADMDGRVLKIPFFSSVRWKGALGLNGTIHARGVMTVDLAAIRGEFSGFRDSQPNSMLDVERLARAVQFKNVGSGLDEETLDFLNSAIAPILAAQSSSVLQPSLQKLKALP
jgi:hypothetical protein